MRNSQTKPKSSRTVKQGLGKKNRPTDAQVQSHQLMLQEIAEAQEYYFQKAYEIGYAHLGAQCGCSRQHINQMINEGHGTGTEIARRLAQWWRLHKDEFIE